MSTPNEQDRRAAMHLDRYPRFPAVERWVKTGEQGDLADFAWLELRGLAEAFAAHRGQAERETIEACVARINAWKPINDHEARRPRWHARWRMPRDARDRRRVAVRRLWTASQAQEGQAMNRLFQYWFPFNNHISAIADVGIAFAWAGLVVVVVAVGVRCLAGDVVKAQRRTPWA